MQNKILLSIYFFLRYIPLMVIGFVLATIFSVVNSSIFIDLLYFLAVNYLAVKYAIIYGIDKNNFITKKDVFFILSILLFIFNMIIYLINNTFNINKALIFSIIPIIMLVAIKTEKEKKVILDHNNQKEINDYFNNKKWRGVLCFKIIKYSY